MAHHFAYVARRAAQLLTTCAAVVVLSATTAHAQNTFELISGGTVSNLPDLRAMTIRDSSLSICYTVFIVQSPTRLLSLAPTLPDDATARSIERARALAEERQAACRPRSADRKRARKAGSAAAGGAGIRAGAASAGPGVSACAETRDSGKLPVGLRATGREKRRVGRCGQR